ncbi:uncharacterized protein LOC142979799 [Anticarsia gemmatalis]|uniref:uncharacterized protein LOC142979799 n=1 Tax=Anticarsia gemmatalis TaxID=129554 RepID=UPI003F7574ED
MKLFIAITLLVAVASADFIKPTPVSQEEAQLQEIIAAIQNPSTNPATVAALEQMLQDLLGIKPEPVLDEESSVDIVDIVDIFPVFDTVAPSEDFVDITPVLDSVAPASSAPLVQIILNINQAEFSPGPIVAPSPVDIVDDFPVFDISSPPFQPIVVGTLPPLYPDPDINASEILN